VVVVAVVGRWSMVDVDGVVEEEEEEEEYALDLQTLD
jgi:carbonic anhydrase/acetyltransferase-like protein (isoleucine patch superfamily)